MNIEEGNACLKQIVAKRNYSDVHSIILKIHKLSHSGNNSNENDVFPTVVQLSEANGRLERNDTYSFDSHGNLLSHQFSVYKGCRNYFFESVNGEKHDMSLDRLRVHGLSIEEMLSSVELPSVLAEDSVVKKLRCNKLGR